jgi:hypothetical protein
MPPYASYFNSSQVRPGEVSQAVEHLPSKGKTLSPDFRPWYCKKKELIGRMSFKIQHNRKKLQ